MNINHLPYIHYFVRSKDGQLISPFEYISGMGGTFYIPLYAGNLAPGYRFHYTIYLGNGEFLADSDGKAITFTGLAIPTRVKSTIQLLMEFNAFTPIPHNISKSVRHFPGAVILDSELISPMFKIASKKPITYGGECLHPDLQHDFIEVCQSNAKVFDTLLTAYGISVIGCDPSLTYEKPITV